MKICIIGAGSPYSPEIFKELAAKKDRLPVEEVALHDINKERLEIIHAFLERFVKRLGMTVKITSYTDWNEALPGADFVITQYRVGGNAARVKDERIPLSHGFIGQETTGPGGMMKALRTIPVALSLAEAMQKHCPKAWMINYTNPSGMIAEALSRYAPETRSVGLCAGGIRPAQQLSKASGAPEEDIRYDYFGLNHLSFAYNFTIKGEPISDDLLQKTLVSRYNEANETFVRAIGLFPSGYMQYYYRTQKRYNDIISAEKTRGERVLELEKIIYDAYANPACDDEPEELSLRGGGGYSQVAIGVLEAIYTNTDRWMVCNVPNQGTIACLPNDAVIETGCIVNSAGIKPLPQPYFPKTVWGLICAVKNYEQLAIDAAVSGDRNLALAALVAHPLVRDVDRAIPLLDELLEANRQYLPNFFKG